MNPLLLQLAMAALGQVMGGGLGGGLGGGFGGGFGGGGGASPFMPTNPMPQQPRPQAPLQRPAPRAAQVPSLQLATLAAATCQMRSGQLNRAQAANLLQQTGKAWGWDANWAQQIPLQRLDGAIRTAGGCTALVERIREQDSGESSTAMAEGFGLSPYR